MTTFDRRRFCRLAATAAACAGSLPAALAETSRKLPFSTVFKGQSKFDALVRKAESEGWSKLPIGDRIVKVARELHGTPYESFTLEIDDHVEAPSVNFDGLDCWTFFEICLGFARMIGWKRESHSAADLLREIEFTRYRGGSCSGNYLERIHYLAEWFFENEARGVADDITRDLGGAQRVVGRDVCEMTKLWKSYRYLRCNPSLRAPMAEHERRVERLPVYYLPKSRVASVESQLRSGDVAGIVTKYDGGFCSHVGLIIRTDDGVARFFHASRDYKRVVIDSSMSGYLNKFSKHAGVIIGRPLEVSKTVRDPAEYRRNLARLTKG